MKIELVLRLCKLTSYSYYKKLGKGKKSGRKPSITTPKINKHGDLEEIKEELVVQRIINTLILPVVTDIEP